MALQIFNDSGIYQQLRLVQPLKMRFLAFLALKPLQFDFSIVTALPALLEAIYKLVKAPAGTYALYLRNSLGFASTPGYPRRNCIPDYLPATKLYPNIAARAPAASLLALQLLDCRLACNAFFLLPLDIFNRK